jgi:hypothetical protein
MYAYFPPTEAALFQHLKQAVPQASLYGIQATASIYHFLPLKPFVRFFIILLHKLPITAGWPEVMWI